MHDRTLILTVTLNPALDVTYRVDALAPYRTHRVGEVAERAGGKGLNVARMLHALSEPVLATGLLGGAIGGRIERLLAGSLVPADFVPVAGESRRTMAVVDDQDATGFWEPGPVVTADEWAVFQAHYDELLPSVAAVTLSGSLPRGLPTDAYAVLIRAAQKHDVATVLDTSGEALLAGVAAGPDVVKPNAEELSTLIDGDLPDAAAKLRALGAGAVVVSAGEHGLVAVTGQGSWAARPPEVVAGNPTGAGDACVAALARGLRDQAAWPQALADAVALSAAAVAAPVAGAFDRPTADRLRPLVPVASLS